MLIWYSQETRSYALVTFFVACSLYFMLRAPRGGAGVRIGWATTACLALASHYFAVFALIPEAAYLAYIYRARMKTFLTTLAAPIAVEAALLPLALHQRASGHAAFIAAVPLRSRIEGAFNWFVLGAYTTTGSRLFLLYLLLAVAVGRQHRLSRDTPGPAQCIAARESYVHHLRTGVGRRPRLVSGQEHHRRPVSGLKLDQGPADEWTTGG